MNVPREIVEALGGNEPTEQQWEAIAHDASPCAVIAGAGSGKTAVMAARVVYLTLAKLGRLADATSEGAMPPEILCLTFTNKAAASLSERVRRATSPLKLEEGEEATVLTYHAFAAQLLRDYGLRIGIEPDQMLLSNAHRWQIATTLFVDRQFEYLEIRSIAYPVRQMLELADHCANHLVDPLELARHAQEFAETIDVKKAPDRDARDTALKRAELARLVYAYQERKRELGVIDYGDQIAYAVRLARTQPGVVDEFRRRWPVVLLDEYQDTNHAQGVLLAALCGSGTSLMCVGDPDQNIYAWRGASLRNILRFPDDFGGVRRPLYVNFRSGSRILAVADAVIESVPAEFRGEDKTLTPHPSRGEGGVRSFVATDENAEGAQIAGLIKDSGVSLRDITILCRKKRLMEPIRRALIAHGIAVEVADLGGLLQIPELVDVVSWLRVLEDPSRNIALARILQGPRFRIGYRDMVALARWSMRHNRTLRQDLGVDEHPGDVAFPLVEAAERLDDEDMIGLSAEARERLREFAAMLGSLRRFTTGPLDALVTQIAEQTGLMRELEWKSTPAAASARRNILNFVAAVSAFAPVEGTATLSTLVTYLDAAEEAEGEDFEQAQPSDEDSVKMMTIHKAKGLEWDVVFVPGLATSRRSKLFPDTDRQPNPVKQPQTLPFELRGDADVLPRYEGNIKAFKEALIARAMDEERRLCYVALTRARSQLVVSAAHWYTGPKEPFEPSRFYEEISQHPACEEIARAELPAESPLVELRRERVPTWPVPAITNGAGSMPKSGDGDRVRYEEMLASNLERIRVVRERGTASMEPAAPQILSVSALLSYERCPRLYYDTYVRPLPRKPSTAARLGTEIHKRIELESLGQSRLFDDGDPDLAPQESSGEPGFQERCLANWRASRFGATPPLYAERAFVLWLDGRAVQGRIDAIFGEQDGPWEVVDYKTGAPDPSADTQLALYGLACNEIWGKKDVTTTIFSASDGRIISPERTPDRDELVLLAAGAASVRGRPPCVCGTCD